YYVQLSAVIDYEGAEWQSIQFEVEVDTVAPSADVSFDPETNTVTVQNAVDEGSGLDGFQIMLNGELIGRATVTEDGEGSFKINTSVTNKDVVTVILWDAAGNTLVENFTKESEEEDVKPVIYILTPEYLDGFDTEEVEV